MNDKISGLLPASALPLIASVKTAVDSVKNASLKELIEMADFADYVASVLYTLPVVEDGDAEKSSKALEVISVLGIDADYLDADFTAELLTGISDAALGYGAAVYRNELADLLKAEVGKISNLITMKFSNLKKTVSDIVNEIYKEIEEIEKYDVSDCVSFKEIGTKLREVYETILWTEGALEREDIEEGEAVLKLAEIKTKINELVNTMYPICML